MKIFGGIFFTVLSFAAIVVGVLSSLLGFFSTELDALGILLGIVGFALLGFIGHLCTKSYLNGGGIRGLGITFIVLSFLQYWLLHLIVLFFITIINIFLSICGKDKISTSSSSKSKTVYEIHDGPYIRHLQEYDRYGGYRYYKDESGGLWQSNDEGKTFTRK